MSWSIEVITIVSLIIGGIIGSIFTIYFGWVHVKKARTDMERDRDRMIKSVLDTLPSPSNNCIHLSYMGDSSRNVIEQNMVALSNLGGSELIIRVEINDSLQFSKKEAVPKEVINNIAESCKPPIENEVLDHSIGDVKFLEVIIKGDDRLHCTSNGQFFIREDGLTTLAGGDEIFARAEQEIIKKQPIFKLAKIAEEYVKIKNAFISISNKEGMYKLCKTLMDLDVQIWATEGTWKELKKLNIKAQKISEMTGFKGLLGNRVKSVHPHIIAGILADKENEKELSELERNDIPLIDLIIINLYPFEEVVVDMGKPAEALLENVDIGGATFIRTAIRNVKRVTIVTDPEEYDTLTKELHENDGKISLETRIEFAKSAWQYQLYYDSLIGQFLDRLKGG